MELLIVCRRRDAIDRNVFTSFFKNVFKPIGLW